MSEDDARAIGRLEGKLERLLSEVAEIKSELKAQAAKHPCPNVLDHEARIKILEDAKTFSKGWIVGAMAVCTAAGWVVARVWK